MVKVVITITEEDGTVIDSFEVTLTDKEEAERVSNAIQEDIVTKYNKYE